MTVFDRIALAQRAYVVPLTFAILALAAVFGRPAPVAAAESAWHETEQTAARLLAATTTTGGATSVRLGLQFRMQPGWKIYWRSPGDAGFPPNPQFEGSDNLAAAEVRWPAPERFSVLGLESLGYKNEVVFPIDVTLARAGESATFRAKVPYLTCDDICIPYVADLELALPSGEMQASDYAHLIDRFQAQVPGNGQQHGLNLAATATLAPPSATAATAESSETSAAGLLRLTATSAEPFVDPDVFLEGPPEVTFSKPRLTLRDGGRAAVLELDVVGGGDVEGGWPTLVNETLVATLVDGPRSAERPVALTPAPAPAAMGMDRTLLSALVLALLGGLILNLMPCVLPVLSLKVLSVVGHGGSDRGHVRLGFLAASAGILFSFLVLASALIALKATGMRIGWGIQFQQPWFLAAMAVIVGAFACNLWGFFEIRLPRRVSDAAVRLDRAADGPGTASGQGTGLWGHFLQGALATLLATPCSAPFLGTAVGFALARGTTEIYAIFAGLGVGLALPYLAIAAFPGLATRLPRPGAWMIRLRQALGLALAATAGWLLWVISGILGPIWAGGLGLLLAALGLMLYLAGRQRGHTQPQATGRRAWAPMLSGVLALGIVAAAWAAPTAKPSAEAAAKTGTDTGFGVAWQPFDQSRIEDLVGQGKTVLVDVTADWCITCQVNKRLVLTQGAVKDAVESGRIIAMVADWTRPDPKISAYLASFGRYGIPFNAVYGPNAPRGMALPELLTETLVVDAMERAGSVATAGR